MKKVLLLFLSLSIIHSSSAQSTELAIQTFGESTDEPILFLHGGPGYNSVIFEKTTAPALAANGFFVLSYDRRGEGRNEKVPAAYNFQQTFEDINAILKVHNLNAVSLIGHSFGGLVATYYTQQNPDKVNALFLVGAPISMPETFQNIIAQSKEIYLKQDDKINLNYISMLEKMDSTSLQYSSYCFMHAMQNGFYSTKRPNAKAVELYAAFGADEELKKYASKMEFTAPQKFWENEQYTTISIKEDLKKLIAANKKIYALYGQEDGLYGRSQVEELGTIIGEANLLYLENCSHSVFIDQQNEFIKALKKWY
ncbi:MAG: alpha/beta hydrolase [Bacteroidota bacterium]